MYLYRFKVAAEGERIPVIIAAGDDQEAFQLVDTELEKYFLRMPDVEDVTLYEKKRIGKGGGYVLYEEEQS
ncbi:MAG: DUF3906 family protein [Firmicutes bacterium]|uniref:DUF3906 family protein n=1 Tax=Melghirimyces thermohalophilus TaxID=1236220 RepID=UPI000B81BCFB|nr:DUF3906 family protein [Melghirimyces thermohalophilus]MDA8354532.1 DUF3906 family protein [Bacillota bacterium]TMZ52481.1 DUF3906 family protein [Klebsiella pneumoniae]